MSQYSIERVNDLSREEFQAAFGPVFENSPWVAEATWPQRPFRGPRHLLETMLKVVKAAGEGAQMALLREHPDLAGRLAAQGAVSAESMREQQGSGLLDLDSVTMAKFSQFNELYTQRFGFPFIICARLSSLDTILAAFTRLEHDRETEFRIALEEVAKIAGLRVRDLVEDNGL